MTKLMSNPISRSLNRYQRLDEDSAQNASQRSIASLLARTSNFPTHQDDTNYVPLQDLSLTPTYDREMGYEIERKPPGYRPGTVFKRLNDKLLGWRAGAMSCAFSSTAVFVINLIVTIWATSKYEVSDGRSTLFNGSCSKMRPLNTFLHVLINALSTVLLSSSNYCMQCLSAPTRAEVEKAHTKGIWLDIGVPSFRNLRHINPVRGLLWAILGLSSLPLHLFYNSAVYSSIAANEYSVYAVTPAFLDHASYDNISAESNFRDYTLPFLVQDIRENASDIEQLSVMDCIDAFAQNFMSDRVAVLMTADVDNSSDVSLLDYQTQATIPKTSDPMSWICDQQSGYRNQKSDYFTQSLWPNGKRKQLELPLCRDHLVDLKQNVTNTTTEWGWRPVQDRKVSECYSRRVDERCKIQFSLALAIVVIILNALKAGIMFYLAYGITENPLMTMGDAVASFLKRPDPFSHNMCLVNKKTIVDHWHWHSGPEEYSFHLRRWYAAASPRRWTMCIAAYVLAFAALIVFFELARSEMSGPTDINSMARLGLGQVNPYAFIAWGVPSEGASGFLANILIANMAQPILSVLYFMYNGLFTCMFLAHEWSSYSVKRKSLRVSSVPEGLQRDTYFLQVPYRYALPLMAASGILHWLVSQSIFLVSVDTYSELKGTSPRLERILTRSFISCGFSPLAIVLVMTACGLMIVVILALGRRRLDSVMPIAGSCSIAMAAACHLSEGEKADEVWKDRVMWGVSSEGHCGFSAKHVDAPVEGVAYR